MEQQDQVSLPALSKTIFTVKILVVGPVRPPGTEARVFVEHYTDSGSASGQTNTKRACGRRRGSAAERRLGASLTDLQVDKNRRCANEAERNAGHECLADRAATLIPHSV